MDDFHSPTLNNPLLRQSGEGFHIYGEDFKADAADEGLLKLPVPAALPGINLHVLLIGDAAGCPPDWWLRRRFCPAHLIYLASRAENTASVNDAILVSAG